jgi:hypothetical protein
MEKHEKLFAKILKENNILYQQSINSSRYFNNNWFSNRNDIFKVFDFMIVIHNRILFIQITSYSNVSRKKSKIKTEFLSKLENNKPKEFDIYIITYSIKNNKTQWKIIKYINDDLWTDVILLGLKWYDLKKVISYLR